MSINLSFDRQHIWHPYSSITNPGPIFPVVSANGVHIQLENGQELIDGMSSWWCALHGYNHPALNQAIIEQTQKVSHVMFGGFTHEPAIRLCEHLVSLTPDGLDTVFLADTGSVSVEVAIKMALQYWHGTKPQKNRLLAFKHGYHGDTFGAMSVCDPYTGMHHLFSDTLSKQIFMEAPPLGYQAEADTKWLDQLETLFKNHHHTLAAAIIEPIVQGAGGMRFYNPIYLSALRKLCQEYQVLLIVDEIATGFGRTGQWFGSNHAQICPDIMCVGKALTGGYLTLAATLCTQQVAETICEQNPGVFMHGPTFMGNPLACAVAVANLELLMSWPWRERIAEIEQKLHTGLMPLIHHPAVADVRTLGAIGVIQLHEPVKLMDIQPKFVEAGIWLRPFGRLIYTMPPFIISDVELEQLIAGIVKVLGDF